jgi:hypothetical protein
VQACSKLHKRYLTRLVDLEPGAYIKKALKETAWNLAVGGKPLTVDVLVSDQARRDGWIHALGEFQAAVTKVLEDD